MFYQCCTNVGVQDYCDKIAAILPMLVPSVVNNVIPILVPNIMVQPDYVTTMLCNVLTLVRQCWQPCNVGAQQNNLIKLYQGSNMTTMLYHLCCPTKLQHCGPLCHTERVKRVVLERLWNLSNVTVIDEKLSHSINIEDIATTVVSLYWAYKTTANVSNYSLLVKSAKQCCLTVLLARVLPK